MLREIITKTLVGKGKLSLSETKSLHLEDVVSKSLGCWIINHVYEVEERNNVVTIKGHYDIELWYALENDQKTSVYKEHMDFTGPFAMAWRNMRLIGTEKFLNVRVNKYPSAVSMTLVDEHTIELKVESQYYLDAFSEAILVVDCKEDETEDLSLEEEIIMNVDPNYIGQKK